LPGGLFFKEDEANDACFIVRDANGQALGYFYFMSRGVALRQTC